MTMARRQPTINSRWTIRLMVAEECNALQIERGDPFNCRERWHHVAD
jgi:hypothetical protein